MKKFLGLSVEQAQEVLAQSFDKVAYKEERYDYTDGTFDIERGFYVLDKYSDYGYYFYVEDGKIDDWTSVWSWEIDL